MDDTVAEIEEKEVEIPPSEENLENTVLEALSPKEKILLLLAQPVDFSSGKEFSSLNTGYITLFGEQLAKQEVAFFITQLQQQRSSEQLALDVLVDHEGGVVQRLSGEGFTVLPSWRTICNSSIEDGLRYFSLSAQELSEVGITYVLGPVVDVGTSDAMGDRICSTDPTTVVAASASFIEAYLDSGITPVIKHFPGLGSLQQDLHTQFDSVVITEKDTEPFKEILDEFSSVAVMSTHVGVENQDAEIPCSFSSDCVGELASVYPNVLKFVDALDMEASLSSASESAQLSVLADASRRAILAGHEVLLYGPAVSMEELVQVSDQLTALYTQDSEFAQQVDRSVKRVVESKSDIP